MENKIINASEFGPEIILDASGTVKITGKSRMEDASVFYKVAHEWLADYLKAPQAHTLVHIELSYFNSSSAKQLLKLLMDIDTANCDAKVFWIHPANNDTLLERGQEFEIMLDIPFEYVAK
jgi:hypothetical protein